MFKNDMLMFTLIRKYIIAELIVCSVDVEIRFRRFSDSKRVLGLLKYLVEEGMLNFEVIYFICIIFII